MSKGEDDDCERPAADLGRFGLPTPYGAPSRASLTEREVVLLRAIENALDDPTYGVGAWKLRRFLPGGSAAGWGATLRSLERKGILHSMTPAQSWDLRRRYDVVWYLTEQGRGLLSTLD